MWEGHSEDISETGRDCAGLWVADIYDQTFWT